MTRISKAELNNPQFKLGLMTHTYHWILWSVIKPGLMVSNFQNRTSKIISQKKKKKKKELQKFIFVLDLIVHKSN